MLYRTEIKEHDHSVIDIFRLTKLSYTFFSFCERGQKRRTTGQGDLDRAEHTESTTTCVKDQKCASAHVRTRRKWGCAGSPSVWGPCPATAGARAGVPRSSRGCWSHPDGGIQRPNPEERTDHESQLFHFFCVMIWQPQGQNNRIQSYSEILIMSRISTFTKLIRIVHILVSS